MNIVTNIFKLIAFAIAIPTVIYPDIVNDHFLRSLGIIVIGLLLKELKDKYYKKKFIPALTDEPFVKEFETVGGVQVTLKGYNKENIEIIKKQIE